MIEINKNELDKFAETMITAYKNTSILKKISQVIDYSESLSDNFFQIGERTLLPMSFFEFGSNVDNTILAGDFARGVIWGEENFIIDHLTKLSREDKLPLVRIKEFSYPEIVQSILKNVNRPTNIFIPIDEPYYNEVHNWVKEGNAKYEDRDLCIFVGGFRVKVHWSTKYTPFNNVVVLDRNGIKIIQKKFEDIKIPKELTKILYSFKEGEPLRLDFAQSKEEDEFDFYFRSVIAIDSRDKDSVGVIELPKIEKI